MFSNQGKTCRFCFSLFFHVFAFLRSNACHLRSFNMILHEKLWYFFSLQLGASYELDHPGYKRIKFVVHWWWPSQVQSPWRVSRRPLRQTSPWYHQLHRLRYDDAVELIPSVGSFKEMEVRCPSGAQKGFRGWNQNGRFVLKDASHVF